MEHQIIEEIELREMIPGFKGRFVHAQKSTIAFWTVDEGAELPEHEHYHEQITQVIEGEFELTVAGKTKRCKPGGIVVIPSFTPHSGEALTPCQIVDIYSPVREDFQ